MPNDKSPGDDDLTKEFFETFQRQAIIKLIQKKKRLIQNWRPFSLLTVDAKIISKALLKPLKNILPSLISDNQSTYVYGRFISGGRCLIADVLQTTDVLKLTIWLIINF